MAKLQEKRTNTHTKKGYIIDYRKFFKNRKNDVKIGKPGSRHNTGSKSASFNRSCRKGSSISKADQNRLKNVL